MLLLSLTTAFCGTQWGGRCTAVLFFLLSLNTVPATAIFLPLLCAASLALRPIILSHLELVSLGGLPGLYMRWRRSCHRPFALKYFHILHLSAAPAHPLGEGLGC